MRTLSGRTCRRCGGSWTSTLTVRRSYWQSWTHLSTTVRLPGLVPPLSPLMQPLSCGFSSYMQPLCCRDVFLRRMHLCGGLVESPTTKAHGHCNELLFMSSVPAPVIVLLLRRRGGGAAPAANLPLVRRRRLCTHHLPCELLSALPAKLQHVDISGTELGRHKSAERRRTRRQLRLGSCSNVEG